MPTYDYHCSNCGEKLEISQKITAEPLKECPKCGKSTLVRGVGGGAGLHFKGTGFYITDYGPRKKEPPSSSEGSCKKNDPKGCCPCCK